LDHWFRYPKTVDIGKFEKAFVILNDPELHNEINDRVGLLGLLLFLPNEPYRS